MKKIVLTMLLLVSGLTNLQAQNDDSCIAGDCHTSYGYYNNAESHIMYHGFYNEGLYEGIGYYQNPDGNWYFSNFKSGKPDGFTVYNDGEGTVCGEFENALKNGPHLRIFENETSIEREVIFYSNGKIVARKKYSATTDGTEPCLTGNCENGFGILMVNNNLVSGFFKDGAFVQGEIQLLDYNVKEYFKSPTAENLMQPYFKYYKRPTQNGIEEGAHMTLGSSPDGQFISLNGTTKSLKAVLFENGKPVKQF